MTYQKIGFLTGVGGNPTGIGDYVNEIDAAGRPAVCFSNDDIAGVDDILKRWEAGSTVPHVAAYRVVKDGSEKYAVPNYALDPADAAAAYFNLVEPQIHPRVKEHKDKVWIFIGNELDKNRSDWLGRWAENSATLWNFHDYRVALFGFASGEPEPEHWEEPGMLAYLRLAAQFPDQIAVNLHEYSYQVDDILDGYPYKVGRFQFLFDVCNKHNIPRPTVLIGEWGWQDRDLPSAGVATAEISDVSNLYGQFPTVLGAGIWYLGPGFDGIANRAQRLISPVKELSKPWAQGEFSEELIIDPKQPELGNGDPVHEGDHKAVILKVPQLYRYFGGDGYTRDEYLYAAEYAHDDFGRSLVTSTDDAIGLTRLGNNESYIKVADPGRSFQVSAIEAIQAAGYVWEPVYINDGEPPPPPPQFRLTHWPTGSHRITQVFGANPENYKKFGLPGHGGYDIEAPFGAPYYAAADGIVSRVDFTDGYGWHVRIKHGDYKTIYAHAQDDIRVFVGQFVFGGQVIAFSGNTGYSSGPHLHFEMRHPPGDLGWLYDIVDPWPYLEPLHEPDPSKEEINLLPYIRGDGRLYEVRNAQGGQERFQTQIDDTGNWYQTKNQNWEQFFQLHDINDGKDYICRDIDTSPGGGRFYRLKDEDLARGSRWGLVKARVGETWEQSRHVQFYNISDCSESTANSDHVVDTMRFVAHYDTYTFRTGFTLQNVIQLEWVNGGEFYWYAKGYGLVAWERKHQDPNTPAWSAISEEHAPGARPDNERLVIPCLRP